MNFKDFYGKYSLDGTFTPGSYYQYISTSRGYKSINETMKKLCGESQPLDTILFRAFRYYSAGDEPDDTAINIISVLNSDAERFKQLAVFDFLTYAEKTDNEWLKDKISELNGTASGSTSATGTKTGKISGATSGTTSNTTTETGKTDDLTVHSGQDSVATSSSESNTGKDTLTLDKKNTRTDNLSTSKTTETTLEISKEV